MLLDLCIRCLQYEAADRPSAIEIIESIQSLLEFQDDDSDPLPPFIGDTVNKKVSLTLDTAPRMMNLMSGSDGDDGTSRLDSKVMSIKIINSDGTSSTPPTPKSPSTPIHSERGHMHTQSSAINLDELDPSLAAELKM